MALKIPITVTNLSVPIPTLETKLTMEAINELLSVAQQCEVLCQTNLEKFGDCSLHKPNTK